MEIAEDIKAPIKSPEAFRTISEASSELGVPQHVLRFWETRFSFIRPMKRAGGRRFYRRQDIAVLKGVRTLLHEAGYTIKGVQRLHKEHGVRLLVGAGEGDIPPSIASQTAETLEEPVVQTPGGEEQGVETQSTDEEGVEALTTDAQPSQPAAAAGEFPEVVAGGRSLELFAEPLETPAAPRFSDTAILKPDARARLDTVLRDIEQAKAAIDDLLNGPED